MLQILHLDIDSCRSSSYQAFFSLEVEGLPTKVSYAVDEVLLVRVFLTSG